MNNNVLSQYPDQVIDGESQTFTTIEMIARYIEDHDASYIGEIKEHLSSEYDRDVKVINKCIEHGLNTGLLVQNKKGGKIDLCPYHRNRLLHEEKLNPNKRVFKKGVLLNFENDRLYGIQNDTYIKLSQGMEEKTKELQRQILLLRQTNEEERIEREREAKMKEYEYQERLEKERYEMIEKMRLEKEEIERQELERQAERLKIEEVKRLEREEIERQELERQRKQEIERLNIEEAKRLEREEIERCRKEENQRQELQRQELERQQAERLKIEEVKRQSAKETIEKEIFTSITKYDLHYIINKYNFRMIGQSRILDTLGDCFNDLTNLPSQIKDIHRKKISDTDRYDNGHCLYKYGDSMYIVKCSRVFVLFFHECRITVYKR